MQLTSPKVPPSKTIQDHPRPSRDFPLMSLFTVCIFKQARPNHGYSGPIPTLHLKKLLGLGLGLGLVNTTT